MATRIIFSEAGYDIAIDGERRMEILQAIESLNLDCGEVLMVICDLGRAFIEHVLMEHDHESPATARAMLDVFAAFVSRHFQADIEEMTALLKTPPGRAS